MLNEGLLVVTVSLTVVQWKLVIVFSSVLIELSTDDYDQKIVFFHYFSTDICTFITCV